jgi:hypothetical protein
MSKISLRNEYASGLIAPPDQRPPSLDRLRLAGQTENKRIRADELMMRYGEVAAYELAPASAQNGDSYRNPQVEGERRSDGSPQTLALTGRVRTPCTNLTLNTMQ